jgi:hypothetical protein
LITSTVRGEGSRKAGLGETSEEIIIRRKEGASSRRRGLSESTDSRGTEDGGAADLEAKKYAASVLLEDFRCCGNLFLFYRRR